MAAPPGMNNATPKRLEKKDRWELRKDASFYFEQIQEAAPIKTAIVPLLASHLINHHCKTNKKC